MRVTPLVNLCRTTECPCVTTTVVTVDGSGTALESGCSLQGLEAPNGSVYGNPGCFYRRTDNATPSLATVWELWYKDSGTLTNTGWTLVLKLA